VGRLGRHDRDDAGIDLALIDRLAGLAHEPDRHLEELRTLSVDQRIAVPTTVFNAVRGQPEAVSPFAHSA